MTASKATEALIINFLSFHSIAWDADFVEFD